MAGAQVLREELQLGGGIAVALLVPHKRELDFSGRPLHSHLFTALKKQHTHNTDIKNNNKSRDGQSIPTSSSSISRQIYNNINNDDDDKKGCN